MAQRGRIIVYQADGKGAVNLDGKMLQFDVMQHWRSPGVPVLNAHVEVELDAGGALRALSTVPPAQLAQEEAARAAALAGAQGRRLWQQARAALGVPVLAALGVLVLGAFAFEAVGVRLFGAVSLSYWQLLGVDASTLQQFSAGARGGFTLAQALFLLSLAACMASWPLRAPQAALGKCAPLAVVVLHALVAWSRLSAAVTDAGKLAGAFGGPQAQAMASQMAREMTAQLLGALHPGLGLFLVLGASAALAWLGWREFRLRAAAI
ncbi:hypothetical protein BKK79_35430 [Cupriavidus sp. USMAA2-4]|uniref:Uncharacterized protein n=1 Tax=Cupriavidus malaysiensis TaxID=367825 RepID=A0ABM6FDF5_9BURK|nr:MULTISPECIES: hypothetical protein [Cupriavidus]AOY96798.1 hypothetical protein BKK79_35430 [Cupriavidus sp. USMAA2-4]AOZ02797.1 hypothetical protein BKK81_26840 [Cupriavidus sp. USMAHM13]AOZ09830.1 hypothetical protein BKK80_29480 [Cupriavidus malaysiensis]